MDQNKHIIKDKWSFSWLNGRPTEFTYTELFEYIIYWITWIDWRRCLIHALGVSNINNGPMFTFTLLEMSRS